MKRMANKIHNIFESGFDSFELDDSFLLEVDAKLKKHSSKDDEEKLNCKVSKKPAEVQKENKNCLKKAQLENLSFFLEDLNESDFFDQSCKSKKKSAKITNNTPIEETKRESSNSAGCCSSPILKPKPKNRLNKSFSSTPLKPIYTSEKEKKKEEKENILKSPNCAYVEADLFDDWNPAVDSEKDSVTLSQAFKLIEEAESAKETDENDLNTSIDLLTGEAVGSEVGDLFDESFSIPKLSDKKSELNDLNDCVILEDSINGKKGSAAQKLNFGYKSDEKKNLDVDFISDDEFDFLTQELVSKSKNFTKRTDCSSDELCDKIPKKGKRCRFIVSDSDEDSSDSEIQRNSKKEISRQKDIKKNSIRKFILSEAEVSDIVIVSSDESEKEGDYDASFVDEELYLTQNYSADMTAKYLESVKNSNRPGQFKIPEPKPYSPECIFSQIPEDNHTEYELDSFCVNDEEEEVKTDLSDLEIAERILEMDRKKRKRRKRGFQR